MAAILTEPGSLNPAERLSAQGLIVVAVREIYFPSNARRSVRHGQSGSLSGSGSKRQKETVRCAKNYLKKIFELASAGENDVQSESLLDGEGT
jgi:hypothetical protein